MLCVDIRKQRGQQGEQLVAQYLQREGFVILAHNYTRRTGEIDLIAKRGNIVAFVEVKARARATFDLTELINKTKQQRIIKAAKCFIMEQALDAVLYRFDVALIENLNEKTISYIPNAFTEQEY
jgi:putative endonuclease